jgi:hypothetical protein
MLGEGQHDRRDEKRARDVVVAKQSQERLELKPGHGDDGRAAAEREIHHHIHSVDVKEGQHADHDVVLAHPLERLDLTHIRDKVAVSEHDALRQPGRAARIGERDEVRERIDRDVRRRVRITEECG